METLKLLNLGCGTKTSNKDGVINVDWSIYLRIKRNKLLANFVSIVLSGQRLERFKSIPSNVLVHNLAKGIPFESNSVDVVYHSHMLEHLDRNVALGFMLEVKRVLKPGGVHRIVVPDFEKSCRSYISHIERCEINSDEYANHDYYIEMLIEQSVRREAFGTSQQHPMIRYIENMVLGDARRRGETHQWAYDRINLKTILVKQLGYREAHIQEYDSSIIPEWNAYGLDVDERGLQYKHDSLYIEAIK